MCTAIFAFGVHPSLLFLLAFNRDEFFARKTASVHEWADRPEIVGPRDLERFGTWFGISRTGRVAFLTNIRVAQSKRSPLSRGMLPIQFLTGTQSPAEFLTGLDVHDYSPLNLLCADLSNPVEIGMFSSKEAEKPFIFEKGIYGVSNGRRNDPRWYKVERGKAQLQEILNRTETDGSVPWDDIFDRVLSDTEEVPEDMPLPETGVDEWRERKFSAMRILPFWNFASPGGLYGTMSQIIVAVWKNRKAEIRERVWDTEQRYRQERIAFQLSSPDGFVA